MSHSIRILRFLVVFTTIFGLFGCETMPQFGSGMGAPQSEADYIASLPNDVYADSRGRLPIVEREELDDEGKVAYDRYMSPDSTSLAGIQGPGGLRLHAQADKSPTRIDGKIRELIRLVIAREMDQAFEWTLHEPVALRQGLDPDIIEVIRRNRSTAGVAEPEASIIQLGRDVFQDHHVSSETYARLTQHFGKKDLIEITQLMGGGINSFILLFMFDVHLPYDRESLLPIP